MIFPRFGFFKKGFAKNQSAGEITERRRDPPLSCGDGGEATAMSGTASGSAARALRDRIVEALQEKWLIVLAEDIETIIGEKGLIRFLVPR